MHQRMLHLDWKGKTMSKDFNDFMNTQDDSMLYDTQDVQNNKIWAALSYVGILFILPLLVNGGQSRYAKYHANQGFILFLAEAVVIIANAILSLTEPAGLNASNFTKILASVAPAFAAYLSAFTIGVFPTNSNALALISLMFLSSIYGTRPGSPIIHSVLTSMLHSGHLSRPCFYAFYCFQHNAYEKYSVLLHRVRLS